MIGEERVEARSEVIVTKDLERARASPREETLRSRDGIRQLTEGSSNSRVDEIVGQVVVLQLMEVCEDFQLLREGLRCSGSDRVFRGWGQSCTRRSDQRVP